ncbi:hypothetical protein Ddc_20397 [Ditylenchus destructor]|nr:hypothetical protein Ddc_20397 [Ditylenchus destructor]
MFVKALRVGLGHVIIAGDFLTRPRKKTAFRRATGTGERSGQGTDPVSVPRLPVLCEDPPHLAPLNVPVALKDAKNNEQARQTLLEQGGKIKVPCLRIEENGQTTWMYDSKMIIDYLDKRFAAV